MRSKDLARILCFTFLFANTIGLIFITQWGQNILADWRLAIPTGIFILIAEFFLFRALLKSKLTSLDLHQHFSRPKLFTALCLGIFVWALMHGWMLYQSGGNQELYPQQSIVKWGLIFLFNSFPNALFEEFIFRFIPVHYARNKQFSPQQLLLLMLVVTLVFSLSHVSVYLLRDHTDLSSLFSALLSAYFFGLVFFFIYILSGNIYFAALVHAFDNNKLLLLNPGDIEYFYFYSVMLVGLLFILAREIKKRAFH